MKKEREEKGKKREKAMPKEGEKKKKRMKKRKERKGKKREKSIPKEDEKKKGKKDLSKRKIYKDKLEKKDAKM